MAYLEDLKNDFIARVNEIVTIGDINEELVTIAVNNLEHLRSDLVATGRNQGILRKVNTQLAMYRQVARIPQLESKFPVLRGQMIVLMVGALEAFLSDVFRLISDNEPNRLTWPDNERIAFEPSLLKTGFSLGDAVVGHLKNKGISFQDLKSSLEALARYLNLNIELDSDIKDELILAGAWRNVIVHNKSLIDHGFLKQVRNTKYANTYSSGALLTISDDDVSSLSGIIVSFGDNIITAIANAD